jgi:hypothetical protein
MEAKQLREQVLHDRIFCGPQSPRVEQVPFDIRSSRRATSRSLVLRFTAVSYDVLARRGAVTQDSRVQTDSGFLRSARFGDLPICAAA